MCPATVLPSSGGATYNAVTMQSKNGVPGVTAAFVVGVEVCPEQCRPPVRPAAADATAFATIIGGLGVAADRRFLLVDGTATKTTIESRLRRLLVGLRPVDTLVVYFVGPAFAAN